MDEVTEYNLYVTSSYTIKTNPVISYTGIFSNSKSYLVGDVVYFSGVLYQAILNASPGLNPLNPSFIPYSGAGTGFNGIYITSSTSLILEAGFYNVYMQGGGAGGESAGVITGGGGGGSGNISIFDLYIPSGSQTFNAVIGSGGAISNGGETTSLNFVPPDPQSNITPFFSTGGLPGVAGVGGSGQ